MKKVVALLGVILVLFLLVFVFLFLIPNKIQENGNIGNAKPVNPVKVKSIEIVEN